MLPGNHPDRGIEIITATTLVEETLKGCEASTVASS
jgi:hypothetical protein